MNGIINLLKPPCLSSAQAVSFVKRLTGQKTGHAGTLDPEACGVLPMMCGKATALFDYIAEHQKVYVAEIAFGTATDTQDATGRIVERGTDYPDAGRLNDAFTHFRGTVMQAPPAFSAIKREGRPLYELARGGSLTETEPRPVQVESVTLLEEMPEHRFLIRVRCGKGTYIRTLCHDLGRLVGCPAHMHLLIREQTGPFRIEDAITMEEFETAVKNGIHAGRWLMSMEQAVSHLPQLTLKDTLWKPCVNGAPLDANEARGGAELRHGQIAALYCRSALIGLFEKQGDRLKLRTMLYQISN